MVEVAEELVEAMDGWQKSVLVTEMDLAELTSRIAHRPQHRGYGRSFIRHSQWCARLSNRRQPGADWKLAGNEICATGRATRLRVVIGEPHALRGKPIKMGRPACHDALVVDPDIEPADVITHNEDDVGLMGLCFGRRREGEPQHKIRILMWQRACDCIAFCTS